MITAVGREAAAQTAFGGIAAARRSHLIDYRVTSVFTAFEEIANRAGLRGAQVRDGDVVGLLPEALVDVARGAGGVRLLSAARC